MDLRIAGKYRIGRKIGSGSFGEVYLGIIINLKHWKFKNSFLQLINFKNNK